MVCETHLTTYINLFLEAIISVSRGLFCREPYKVSNSLANVESTTDSSLSSTDSKDIISNIDVKNNLSFRGLIN